MHHSFYFTTLFHRSCIRHRPTTTFPPRSTCRQPFPAHYSIRSPPQNSSTHARSFDCRVKPPLPPPPDSMNDDIPPTPPAHILAKCDTILQDLVIQQRNLDKIFADGWPTSNRSAGRTPKPSRSHCVLPLPLLPQQMRQPRPLLPLPSCTLQRSASARLIVVCHCRPTAAATAAAAPTAAASKALLRLPLPLPLPRLRCCCRCGCSSDCRSRSR
jgi:hypothetical protein